MSENLVPDDGLETVSYSSLMMCLAHVPEEASINGSSARP